MKPSPSRPLIVVAVAAVVLGLAFAVVLNQPGSGPSPLSAEAWQRFWNLLQKFAGSELTDNAAPAYFEGSFWNTTWRQALDTLNMSLLAICLAGLGLLTAVLVFQPAARHNPESSNRPAIRLKLLQATTRLVFVLTRSIPEYVWALLTILVFKPGIFAGALALGIHNFGVLGRLTTGTITTQLASGTSSADTTHASQLALASAGASRSQLLLYGTLPTYAPELVTFYLYRWEVIIRASIVVGFITNAGLGFELRQARSSFFFTELAGILLAYLVLVLAVDLIAAGLRKLHHSF